jgi:SAM-dependent methyltransferase
LYRCDRCSLVFRCTAITASEAEELYASITGDAWQYAASGNVAWDLALRKLGERPPGSVLDIGSFDGQFLQRVPGSWRRAAIEPNPVAVRRLQDFGIETHSGILNSGTCERLRGQFDVVTMFDVFEHLLDPVAGVAAALSCVRAGGELWLTTGNADHWTWRLLGSQHPYLAPLQHVVFGGATFFRGLSQRQGWSPPRLTRIPHRRAGVADRAQCAAMCVYFGARRRGGLWKGLVRLAHSVPAGRDWLHRRYMPHISVLADHLFVVIRA